MDNTDSSGNSILPTVYTNSLCLDDEHTNHIVHTPLLSVNQPIERDVGTRTVTVNDTDIHITVAVETGSMTLSEPARLVNGRELLARLSELSIEIQHDSNYAGDYFQLYNLMTALVTKT
jgi:hypothetical protein